MLNYRRVYGGSAEDEESSLCDQCTYSLIMKGHAESEKLTICDRMLQPVRVPFRVVECSCYSDKRLPDVSELEDIAVPLVTHRQSKSTTGFGSPRSNNGVAKDSS